MTDATENGDADDLIELREDVAQEVDDVIDDAAEEERERMAERDAQGIDEPRDAAD